MMREVYFALSARLFPVTALPAATQPPRASAAGNFQDADMPRTRHTALAAERLRDCPAMSNAVFQPQKTQDIGLTPILVEPRPALGRLREIFLEAARGGRDD